MNLKQSFISNLTAFLLLNSLSSWAIDVGTTSVEPIKIEANQAELNDITGQAAYSGNVIITQGRSKLEAEKVSVETDSNGIKGFTATTKTGKLVYLMQYDAKKETVTHAYARIITYNREKNEIHLRKNAKLLQDDNSFQGEEITYNLVSRIVSAEASTDKSAKGGRVEIIYNPTKAKQ